MTEKGLAAGGMSRRGFIGAGAALGAGLLLPSWSWAGAQSVAGIGGATPPWQVWDDEADPVIAAVIERGEGAAGNAPPGPGALKKPPPPPRPPRRPPRVLRAPPPPAALGDRATPQG